MSETKKSFCKQYVRAAGKRILCWCRPGSYCDSGLRLVVALQVSLDVLTRLDNGDEIVWEPRNRFLLMGRLVEKRPCWRLQTTTGRFGTSAQPLLQLCGETCHGNGLRDQFLADQLGDRFGVNSAAFVVTRDDQSARLAASFVMREDAGVTVCFQFPVPAVRVFRVMEQPKVLP